MITTARLLGTLAFILGVVAFGELVLGTPRLYTGTAQLIAGALAAVVCLSAGRDRSGVQRLWRLLTAVGLLVWSLNRLWWIVQELTGAGRPPQVLTWAGLSVLPVCMLAGLLAAVHTRPRPVPTSPLRDQFALVIDSLLITGSVLGLIWSVLPMPPAVEALDVIPLVCLIADLVLFTMVVLLLTTRPDSPAGRRPLRLVGSALLAFGVADTVQLLGRGPAWLEGLGHLLGPAFIVMAALSPNRAPVPQPDPEVPERDWFRVLLPYGPVVVTGVVLVVRTLAEGALSPFEAYLGWFGLVLVVTRQMITIVDNTVLFDRVATAQRRLHHQAYHDPLTGLANRALFQERLVLAIDAHQRRGTPVAVLFADLDDFKLVNDTFGHAIGDRVLQAIGERMRAGVRAGDLVARLGGDEFAIVLDQGGVAVPAPRARVPWRRRGDGALRQRRYVLSAAGVRVSEAAFAGGARVSPSWDASGHAGTAVASAVPEGAVSPAGQPLSGDGPAGFDAGWEAEAEAIGRRVLTMLREPYVIDGRSVGVGASVGLVTAEPGDTLTADLLLRRADAAMYAVKRRGKGELVRYSGPRDSAPHADLPQLLAGALSGGNPAAAGFDVHYQPIVRLSDGATVAVEALARWTDPVAGPVHPDVFVTMAERTGLVAAIDDFVLDRACADVATLADRYGRPIDVHVNVSAGRLAGSGLEDAVRAALNRHRLDPARLIIEITETLRIPDLPCAAGLVERLRALGVRVALDDFGSGFNALAQLHTIPVDIVKLDSTLTDVDTSPDRAGALCRSVLAICAELGVTVVAEGLETGERAGAMAALGCPLGQGYLYGAPAPLAGLPGSAR